MENKKITLTAQDAERLEMLVLYYDHHGVGDMLKRRPEFVEDDFTEVLKILEKALQV